MLFNTCPATSASEGYVSARCLAGSSLLVWRTPMTSTRSAPKCSAGLIGASCPVEPSPKYSRFTLIAGNTKGIAAEASR